jgi:hypothetical protein
MYILDKNKDYYDHLGKTYGVDKTIVYDRRGSVPLTELSFLTKIVPSYIDYKQQYSQYYSNIHHLFIVEIGTTQYLFGMYDIKYKATDMYKQEFKPYSCSYEFIRSFKDNKHYYEKEITIVPMNRDYFYSYRWMRGNREKETINSFNELKEIEGKRISNPILKETIVPSYIKDLEVWKDLSTFISSKYNDKTITIKNTDVEMAINHGFDKVTSFRHPIKM